MWQPLCYWVPYFYLAVWATEVFCVVRIIASDDNPDYKVPWLLFVLIVPIAGFMLYFVFYDRKLQKKFVKRLQNLKDNAHQKDDSPLFEQLREEKPAACGQAQMLCRIAESHLFAGTKQEYFPLGEDMRKRMLCDLMEAEEVFHRGRREVLGLHSGHFESKNRAGRVFFLISRTKS